MMRSALGNAQMLIRTLARLAAKVKSGQTFNQLVSLTAEIDESLSGKNLKAKMLKLLQERVRADKVDSPARNKADHQPSNQADVVHLNFK